ncbi:hypothetical protein M407DRAFT_20747 [Tulasnella calospora MUT 4182]|uniref:Uncharacterized protein n=1 Tax=Tulasnella calospora MUT 4182 TaxID=1051891 RepID=A0A0C3QFC3_9AGAM|nr:hypothetical protein M407DRAFT_20747 [Tulasnella calospora MUT 4182]
MNQGEDEALLIADIVQILRDRRGPTHNLPTNPGSQAADTPSQTFDFPHRNASPSTPSLLARQAPPPSHGPVLPLSAFSQAASPVASAVAIELRSSQMQIPRAGNLSCNYGTSTPPQTGGHPAGRLSQRTPSLGRSPLVVDKHPQMINVEILLYPPVEQSPDLHPGPLAYYCRSSSFISHLNALHRVLFWNDVDINTSLIDLVERATRDFETGELRAEFTFPLECPGVTPLALALLVLYNRGREVGDPPARRLRFQEVPAGVRLREALHRTQTTPSTTSVLTIPHELCFDLGQPNTLILRLTPQVPQFRCVHPETAPDARHRHCDGSCVFDKYTTDNPMEAVLIPDSSSPPAMGIDSLVEPPSPPSIPFVPPSTPQLQPTEQALPQSLGVLFAMPFRERRSTLSAITNLPSFIASASLHATNPDFPLRNQGI